MGSALATRIRAVVGGDGLAHFTGTAGGPVAMLGANAAANYHRAGSYPWIHARLTTRGWQGHETLRTRISSDRLASFRNGVTAPFARIADTNLAQKTAQKKRGSLFVAARR